MKKERSFGTNIVITVRNLGVLRLRKEISSSAKKNNFIILLIFEKDKELP